jgi:hypothetical protein
MSREEYNYKRHAIKAARELCYGENTIEKLHNAKTEIEILEIMSEARRNCK